MMAPRPCPECGVRHTDQGSEPYSCPVCLHPSSWGADHVSHVKFYHFAIPSTGEERA